MEKPLRQFCLLLTAALVLAPVVWPRQSQDQQQQQQQQQQQGQAQQPTEQAQQPIPAYHPPLSGLGSDDDQDQNANSPTETPDTHPLAGVQQLGVGGEGIERSYWEPSASVYSVANSAFGPGRGWAQWATLLGSIEAHRDSARNELILDYTGGGMVSSSSAVGDFVLQQVELGDTITLRRSTISLLNYTSYMPLASFGFAGLGGMSLPGTGTLGLETALLPSQSILSNFGQHIANSDIVQINTNITGRSSLTMIGGYSLLHFFEGSLLDSNEPTAQIGYNYQLTRRDTVALLYNFADYQYTGLHQSITTNRADLSYGRRVTGRMAFQIAAGPEAVTFNLPNSTISTATGSETVTRPSGAQLYWDLNASLQYALSRTTFGLNYTHGVNGGSGVLEGAEGSTVVGTVTHDLSRQLQVGATGGYARNKEVLGQPYTYDFWYGTGHLSRQLGRTVSLTLSYEYQRQSSTASFCIANSCGKFDSSTISAGVSWHDHPIAF
ncbi:MAG TPA: hypothetical protein VEJ67_11700 [Candidatus Cybelea sp.]|nr:hypothetical protein [Candidatus Cybelea sp.]